MQTRFEQYRQGTDLDEVIHLHRATLELRHNGHPKLSAALNNLANSVRMRFEQYGRKEDLDEAVDLYRATLELRANGHPFRSSSLGSLATALRIRFEQHGQTGDLDEAIRLHRAALELRPKGNQGRCIPLNNLANSMKIRFDHYGQAEDLDEAIDLHRAALELRPTGHPDRSISLSNLGNSLRTRFRLQGLTEDLDEAVELHRTALELFPNGHLGRSTSLSNLATSLKVRFENHGRTDDINEAAELHHAALELRPIGHPDRFQSLNNLASAMQIRFRQLGQAEDLDKVIELHCAALDLCPKGYLHRSASLSNLANSMITRFEQYGEKKDLDKAVELHCTALELRPNGHPDRYASLNNLANTVQIRFEHYGLAEDLDKAIEMHRIALELSPTGHPGRSTSLHSLATDIISRFEQQGREEDLDEAVELHRAALELRPKGHPLRSSSLNNLANSMLTRFEQYGQIEDLDEAIELHRDCLKLQPESHPDRSAALSNLANAVITRFQQNELEEDIDEGIELHFVSLELRQKGHPDRSASLGNLATAMSIRFEQYGREKDLDEAIELYHAALELQPEAHPDRSGSLKGLANSVYARIEQQWHTGDFAKCMGLLELAATHEFSGLSVRLGAARRWAVLARLHDHDSALSAYRATMSILQRALTISPTLHEQHNFLIRNIRYTSLTMEAASYAIEKNKLERAVEILEQGRGLLWSQLRGFRYPLDQLAETKKELVNRFTNVSRRLENLATSYQVLGFSSTVTGGRSLALDVQVQKEQKAFDELLSLKKRLSAEREEVIGEIRRVPGFESFLDATPFHVLQQAASAGPVVAVNHCEYRCDALIILPSSDLPITCVPLDGEFYEDSIKLYDELSETRRNFGAASSNYDEKLCKAMKVLWDRCVSKVVGKLRELGIAPGSRIWWCPTSILSAFPFHAAGPFKDADGTTKYLLDDYILSYTPTLGALISARSGITKGDLSEEGPTVLVIGDSSLRSARQEIKNIRNCGTRTKLLFKKKGPTRDTVIQDFRTATWVHFVCHGLLGSKPFNPSFNISDGGLTLLDIVQANLPNAEFAFLSACHTAEQHHEGAQDEVFHLAAAIQFSGFRSVIGTMWELLDGDGPHFAKTVYEYINDCDEGEQKYKRAAAGLRKAALELKARDEVATERWVNLVHIGA